MSNVKGSPSRVDFRKHVATVHVSGELSLLERKIVNVLLLNAYDELLTKTTHSVPVGVLSTMLGFDSKNTGALKVALGKIMRTPLTFDLLREDGNNEWHATPLLAYAGIVDGICSYEYSDWLARKLANPESYTLININIQKQFSGSYALALYENCLRFRNTGSTGWITVEKWRMLLGATSVMYAEFKHFSAEVIKKAVKEVNEVSNITITPEYQRENRRVVRIRFIVETNSQKSLEEGVDNEEGDEIRRSATFKRLVAIGIGDRLAINFIQQDPERAEKTALYTEQQLRHKKVKGNAAGYARTVFQNGNEILVVSETEPGAKPANATDKSSEKKADKLGETKAKETTAAIKALTLEQRRAFALAYMEEVGLQASYQEEKAEFSNALERVAFTNWLRLEIAARIAVGAANP
jgi:hypothetical protein